MEPSIVFAAAKAFGAGAGFLYRTTSRDYGVSITVKQSSSTYSLFVPHAVNVKQCSPPSPDEIVNNTRPAARWIKRNRALPIGVGEFSVIVQPKHGTSVVIDGIAVHTRIAHQVSGIALKQALGGPIVAISLEIDLNTKRVRCIDSSNFPKETRIDPLFSVCSDQPLVLRVSGAASAEAVLWQLELSMVVDGHVVKRRVPAEGEWITVPDDYDGVCQEYRSSNNTWVLSAVNARPEN
ncbi:hypothetical protein H7J87_16290 [Mycolicibacterium wolinskyi]|uniref:hypothetical protein n=1 Tax=Mycolicibacterium TaxID=1866885 RepID=UPI0010553F37|nr:MULTISPECIES: hypothetical protein [Mycolicibacterium]MCV7286885.1 hypothetical protein [Mycolicibacterium wolinskyi]MCV7293866.1 hypothetical protein [Mycolicibacterium goodii]